MNFYVLKTNGRYKEVDFDDDFEHFDSVICPVEPGHQRAERNDLPLHIEFVSKKYGDFTDTWFSDLIITKKQQTFLRNKTLADTLCMLMN